MKRNTIISLLTLIAVLIGTTAVFAETLRSRIRPVGAVYTFIADTSQSTRVSVMWEFPDTDIDVGVFDEDGNTVAISVASTDGLEIVEFGVVRGVLYDVVLSKFEGRNSKYQVNVSTARSELILAPGGGNLTYLGDLATLAAEDERYAEMKGAVERVQARKR